MINNYLDYEQQEYRPSHKVYTHDQLGNHIHLGDISSALDHQFLVAENICTVLTAASGMDHVIVPSHVNHIVYPLLDIKSENISKYFTQFYDLMEKQLQKGSVLVHCAAGISRSSTLVIAYLMRKHNWGFKETIQFVRKSRPSVLPNLGFERQLKDYEGFLSRKSQSVVQRRYISKTSQERKHLSNPNRNKQQILPQIGVMQKTQVKAKLFDIFSHQPEKRMGHRSKILSQEGKKQEIQFYGTKRMAFKGGPKPRGKSERMNIMPMLSREQMPVLQGLKVSMPIDRIEDIMVRRLNLQSKKMATERQLRTKPLHKIAYY